MVPIGVGPPVPIDTDRRDRARDSYPSLSLNPGIQYFAALCRRTQGAYMMGPSLRLEHDRASPFNRAS